MAEPGFEPRRVLPEAWAPSALQQNTLGGAPPRLDVGLA